MHNSFIKSRPRHLHDTEKETIMNLNVKPELREVYTEIKSHLINDDKPSEYLNSISDSQVMREYPFSMRHELKTTGQSPDHHPEGNVWNHTLLVVDEAAMRKSKSKNPEAFMVAALLHDIGKPATTKIRKGNYTAYNHDKAGARMCKESLSCFTDDNRFIKEVSELVRYHMQILFVVKDMPFADIKGMMENTDFNEIALLGICDRLGRTKGNREAEKESIRIFIEKCNRYLAKP